MGQGGGTAGERARPDAGDSGRQPQRIKKASCRVGDSRNHTSHHIRKAPTIQYYIYIHKLENGQKTKETFTNKTHGWRTSPHEVLSIARPRKPDQAMVRDHYTSHRRAGTVPDTHAGAEEPELA